MKKKLNKWILHKLVKIFKPKDKIKFVNTASKGLLVLEEIPTDIGILAMGALMMGFTWYNFLFSVFALANTLVWRIKIKSHPFFKGGDHSPASCFIASLAIFGMFFAICNIIDNWLIEYALAIALAFFFRNWKIY